MDSRIENLVEKLGVQVIYTYDLKIPGCYVPLLNVIVINSNLTDLEKYSVLLHELGHAAKHQNECALYHTLLHSKMESEADHYMIDQLLDDYITTLGLEPKSINPVKFLEAAKLSLNYEPYVKRLLSTKFFQ
ncbi:ImmA/IrrE family metallo-endopeptidase [Enterococcus hirae]|uniref:ImmA/IrrE family metallo-endopeptidase n=1 Tax=Enterococcus hirae TaxID=1354 RepID=UPI002DBCB942|nr:ImmA/IrrE family metallo-endopeptidase [Enterococcus hirae]MEB5733448.1 ImmA/IrrE family metallo-endopeptidase [Enterococcus hirae]